MITVNEYFDRIYCLNLDRRKDKWERLSKRFEKLNISVERFSAIDGKHEDIVTEWKLKKQTADLEKQPFMDTSGKMACDLSHRKIIEDAKYHNFDNFLVFEDDVLFHKDFHNQFQKIQQIKDWKMIYLGSSHSAWNGVKFLDNGFYLGKRSSGIFATAFHSSIYDHVLSLPMIRPLDVNMELITQPKFHGEIFVFHPNIVIADVEDSDLCPGLNMQREANSRRWDLKLYNR